MRYMNFVKVIINMDLVIHFATPVLKGGANSTKKGGGGSPPFKTDVLLLSPCLQTGCDSSVDKPKGKVNVFTAQGGANAPIAPPPPPPPTGLICAKCKTH